MVVVIAASVAGIKTANAALEGMYSEDAFALRHHVGNCERCAHRNPYRERNQRGFSGTVEGIEQIDRAVTQMDNVTQQNAALVEQAAAAAASLQDQTGALDNAVAVFRLRGPRQPQPEEPCGPDWVASALSIA
ncbi:hypothetical protein [Paraburkholderia sp. BL25I1N1]|uniref:hypothetical protein n=1 Tax=Paraburkholderia sp. BL25I1N1 TaxID=1938804 RepID=UPI000D4D65ED|nr:methyl-accepting chemotaxis protein (MCP) signaling protein [Paraburkholderia sp. BL25I1N1]